MLQPVFLSVGRTFAAFDLASHYREYQVTLRLG